MTDESLEKVLKEDMEEYYNQTSDNPGEVREKYRCNESDYYNSRRLQRQAYHLILSDKTYEALGLINQAIEINPHDEESWLIKGINLQRIARKENSLKFCSESYNCLKRALEYESDNKTIIKKYIIDLVFDWSRVFYYWKKHAKALDKLDEYFILATNTTCIQYARALELKGLLLTKRRDFDRALEFFDKAIEIAPDVEVIKKSKEMCLEKIDSSENINS